jgi:hypothetical protein
MRFFGWVFLIVGIFSVLLMPILGLLIIIIGAILLSVGWKGKDRKDAKKARKLRYKAAKARMGGDIERAEYLEVKAKKYE